MRVDDITLYAREACHAPTYARLNLVTGTLECVYLAGYIADDLGKIELQNLANQLKGFPLVIAGPSEHHAGRIFFRDA